LPVGLDHGCAAKTWATAPPLKTVVLIGSTVSGARKIRSPAHGTAGWIGGGTDEVRAGVAQGLDSPTGAVIGASRSDPVGAPVGWSDVAVERDGHLQDQ